jgi:hypothetical protein
MRLGLRPNNYLPFSPIFCLPNNFPALFFKNSKLITAFNISFAPQWTLNDGKGFTLIFEGLSKGCTLFDLKEIIPQDGGFEIKGIPRNTMDVYQVRF